MPKRTGVVTRNTLTDAALPEATDTYTVISHASIINMVLQKLDENGFTVADEIYKCNDGAQVASGVYRLNYGDDPDMGMIFAFANSYDKSMRFKCAVGGYVHVNKASIIASHSSSWGRKHTGTADDETAETIEQQVENAEAYFKQLQGDKDRMKGVSVTKRKFSELLGVLYMELKILSGEQMGIIRREFEKPSFNYATGANSLWTLYNHILVALAKSHPRTWMEQQKIVHFHIISEFDLGNFDAEEGTDVAPQATGEEETHETQEVSVSSEEVEEDDPSSHELEMQAREEAETAADSIDAVPEPEEVKEAPAKAMLPGFGNTPQPKFTHEATEDELNSELHGVDNNPESVIAEGNVEEFEMEPEDIMITISDIESMFPGAVIGDTIVINEASYEIIAEKDDTYILRAEDLDALPVEEDEVPVMQAPELLEDATIIHEDDLNGFFPGVEVGDEVELEGFPMKVMEKRGENFTLVPNTQTKPSKAVLPEAPVKEKPEPEMVKNDAEEPIEFLGDQEMPSEEEPDFSEMPALESEEDDAVRTVISKELYDVYGSFVEYNYVTKGDQYNITLLTGETFVLPKAEIDKRAAV